jgi:hypothetical protein
LSVRASIAGLLLGAVMAAMPATAQRMRYVQGEPHNRPQGEWRRGEGGRNGGPRPGDWLRRHQNLPPAEQQRALENDPAFRNLPAERQQQLRQRLQHFSSLPPEQQNRILQRMQTFERLSPQQRQQARDLYGQFHGLPPERQAVLQRAFRGMHDMTPAERQRLVDSPAYRSTFTDQERNILRGMSSLDPPR